MKWTLLFLKPHLIRLIVPLLFIPFFQISPTMSYHFENFPQDPVSGKRKSCEYQYLSVPYICDPDHLLTRTTAQPIHEVVRRIGNMTYCGGRDRCGHARSCSTSYKLNIVLAETIHNIRPSLQTQFINSADHSQSPCSAVSVRFVDSGGSDKQHLLYDESMLKSAIKQQHQQRKRLQDDLNNFRARHLSRRSTGLLFPKSPDNRLNLHKSKNKSTISQNWMQKMEKFMVQLNNNFPSGPLADNPSSASGKSSPTHHCNVDLLLLCVQHLCLDSVHYMHESAEPFLLALPENRLQRRLESADILRHTSSNRTCDRKLLQAVLNLEAWFARGGRPYGHGNGPPGSKTTVPMWAAFAFAVSILLTLVCFLIGNMLNSTAGDRFKSDFGTVKKPGHPHKRWGAGFGGGLINQMSNGSAGGAKPVGPKPMAGSLFRGYGLSRAGGGGGGGASGGRGGTARATRLM